jgi:hypothetical protein
MPYELIQEKGGWFVAKQSNPKRRYSKKPFETKKAATEQMKALYASENKEMEMKESEKKMGTKKRIPMKGKSPKTTGMKGKK